MKAKVCFFIILLMICKFGKGQNSDSLWTVEKLSNVTVYLFQKIDTLGKAGTGTIIKHNNKFYLLTASHVAKELKNDSKIVFRTDGDKPYILDLMPLTKDLKLKWKDHPEADLSIIELTPFRKDIAQRLNQWSFPSYLIYKEELSPPRDQDVTFLGFPLIDLEMKHFSPLSFTAFLSSGLITGLRADNKRKCTFFYLDKPSMEGCSGGGVYFSVKKSMYFTINKTLLVGVVHGTVKDGTGGKIASITPSFYVWDLIKDLK